VDVLYGECGDGDGAPQGYLYPGSLTLKAQTLARHSSWHQNELHYQRSGKSELQLESEALGHDSRRG
jgi:hypothetical protein